MDTDHLGVLQHHTSPECTRLMLRMQACSDTDMYVSIISFHEQVLGWNAYLARAKEAVSIARAYQRFQQILADFSESQVLPFDLLAAGLFDEMRAQRVRIGTMDSIGTGQHSQIGHNDRMSNLLAAMRRLARDRVHARAVRLPIAALVDFPARQLETGGSHRLAFLESFMPVPGTRNDESWYNGRPSQLFGEGVVVRNAPLFGP